MTLDISFFQFNERGPIFAARNDAVMLYRSGDKPTFYTEEGQVKEFWQEAKSRARKVKYSEVPNALRAALKDAGWANTQRKHKGDVR